MIRPVRNQVIVLIQAFQAHGQKFLITQTHIAHREWIEDGAVGVHE